MSSKWKESYKEFVDQFFTIGRKDKGWLYHFCTYGLPILFVLGLSEFIANDMAITIGLIFALLFMVLGFLSLVLSKRKP